MPRRGDRRRLDLKAITKPQQPQPRPGKASLDSGQEAGDKEVRRAGPVCRPVHPWDPGLQP